MARPRSLYRRAWTRLVRAVPWLKGRTNCLFFSLIARRRLAGCYHVTRPSHFGWWRHRLVLTKDRRHFVSFKPDDPNAGWRRKPWFKGRMRWGDRYRNHE